MPNTNWATFYKKASPAALPDPNVTPPALTDPFTTPDTYHPQPSKLSIHVFGGTATVNVWLYDETAAKWLALATGLSCVATAPQYVTCPAYARIFLQPTAATATLLLAGMVPAG